MGRLVTIRLNDQEEEALMRCFAGSGDQALSQHIKRVYFNAAELNGAAVAAIQNDVELIAQDLAALRAANARQDANLALNLLSGLYLMVRKSVAENVRSQADKYLDHGAIETYLKEGS